MTENLSTRSSLSKKQLFVREEVVFDCGQCGHNVEALGVIAIDHCPECLYSQHLDLTPGDRAEPCGGLMEPLAAKMVGNIGIVIKYRCLECGGYKQMPAADSDNMEVLIGLLAMPFYEL